MQEAELDVAGRFRNEADVLPKGRSCPPPCDLLVGNHPWKWNHLTCNFPFVDALLILLILLIKSRSWSKLMIQWDKQSTLSDQTKLIHRVLQGNWKLTSDKWETERRWKITWRDAKIMPSRRGKHWWYSYFKFLCKANFLSPICPFPLFTG